jgi:hypothetical protein
MPIPRRERTIRMTPTASIIEVAFCSFTQPAFSGVEIHTVDEFNQNYYIFK